MTSLAFVNQFRSQLEEMAAYACFDAATFSQCINPTEKIMILDRLKRAGDRKAKDVGIVGGFQVGTAWNASALRNVYERVRKERAGVCTTFAKSAAHIFGTAPGLKPRLEIVGFTNHVFVVVGRAGDYIEEGSGFRRKMKLPSRDRWGAGYVIVDVWVGAMGWPKVIYPASELNDYPFPGMLDPLTLVMERPAGP